MKGDAVAIVGAGPAGSLLATLLARARVPTVLFDRARFPRPKPCGECLSAESTRLLARLGLLDAVERHATHLEGWRIFAPAGHAFAARFRDVDALDGALALPRAILDATLLGAARAAGATVRTPVTVTDFRPGAPPTLHVRGEDGAEILEPGLIVGADGLRSVIARRAGAVRRAPRTRKLSLTGHITGADLDAWGEMHVAPGMCAGLAAVGDGVANLTVVADADLHGNAAKDPLRFFRTALRRFPALPDRLTKACLGGRPLSGTSAERVSAQAAGLLASGPFDVPMRRTTGPGWVLVGDAAGYFDPFTGQGIHHALRGAELLADAILEHRAGDATALSRFAADYRRITRPARALQRTIDAILRRPRLADVAIRRLAQRPDAARAILAATADLVPPSSLLSPSLLLSFALPSARSSQT